MVIPTAAAAGHNALVSVTVERETSKGGLATALLVGAAVTVVLGVYAAAHQPAGRPLVTFGFSGMLQMKAWLTTAAALLLVVQLLIGFFEHALRSGVASATVSPTEAQRVPEENRPA